MGGIRPDRFSQRPERVVDPVSPPQPAQDARLADVGTQTTADYGMGLAPIFFFPIFGDGYSLRRVSHEGRRAQRAAGAADSRPRTRTRRHRVRSRPWRQPPARLRRCTGSSRRDRRLRARESRDFRGARRQRSGRRTLHARSVVARARQAAVHARAVRALRRRGGEDQRESPDRRSPAFPRHDQWHRGRPHHDRTGWRIGDDRPRERREGASRTRLRRTRLAAAQREYEEGRTKKRGSRKK